MDITDHHSCPSSSPQSEGEVGQPHAWAEEHPFEPNEALGPLERLSRVRREVVRSPVYASEARDEKIRELQDAIKHGTYHVTPQQIADKMLRSMLLDDLL
jgi:anti-sigma28 factor (negative regulator of flagellin synthesis)